MKEAFSNYDEMFLAFRSLVTQSLNTEFPPDDRGALRFFTIRDVVDKIQEVKEYPDKYSLSLITLEELKKLQELIFSYPEEATIERALIVFGDTHTPWEVENYRQVDHLVDKPARELGWTRIHSSPDTETDDNLSIPDAAFAFGKMFGQHALVYQFVGEFSDASVGGMWGEDDDDPHGKDPILT